MFEQTVFNPLRPETVGGEVLTWHNASGRGEGTGKQCKGTSETWICHDLPWFINSKRRLTIVYRSEKPIATVTNDFPEMEESSELEEIGVYHVWFISSYDGWWWSTILGQYNPGKKKHQGFWNTAHVSSMLKCLQRYVSTLTQSNQPWSPPSSLVLLVSQPDYEVRHWTSTSDGGLMSFLWALPFPAASAQSFLAAQAAHGLTDSPCIMAPKLCPSPPNGFGTIKTSTISSRFPCGGSKFSLCEHPKKSPTQIPAPLLQMLMV